MSEVTRCPICGEKVATQKDSADYGDKKSFDCKKCGEFEISNSAISILETKDIGSTLSAWIRERNILKIETPTIKSSFLNDVIKTLPNYSPIEKLNKLLKSLELLTKYPGQLVRIDAITSAPLAWASNDDELTYYVTSLAERGLIDIAPRRGISDTSLFMVKITANGWEYIQNNKNNQDGKTQAFVAMSFNPDLKPAYENAIHPAILATGYRPYRVDSVPHIDRIDVKIISEIRNSKFMIADVTEQKAGVYYEAGFAHGLGIPVIWSVRKDHLEKVHFDTRQYNHIVWESEDDFKNQIESFILAIIGKIN